MTISYQCPYCRDCFEDASAAMLDIREDGKHRCDRCEILRVGYERIDDAKRVVRRELVQVEADEATDPFAKYAAVVLRNVLSVLDGGAS